MRFIFSIISGINWIGSFLPQLALRFILAYEFWKAGIMKYNGSNWFNGIQDSFPYPLSIVPTEISWFLATWSELLGAIALLIGLGTRFFSFSLMILVVVAIMSVHMPAAGAWNTPLELWNMAYHHNAMPNGSYGFELPLLYLIMLLPLFFSGAGKLSLDHFISGYMKKR